jgi:hypothetical protein
LPPPNLRRLVGGAWMRNAGGLFERFPQLIIATTV